MTPERERELIDECSAEARRLPSDVLLNMFSSAVIQVEGLTSVFGPQVLKQLGEEAEIEFAVLRSEIEERQLIRFH